MLLRLAIPQASKIRKSFGIFFIKLAVGMPSNPSGFYLKAFKYPIWMIVSPLLGGAARPYIV